MADNTHGKDEANLVFWLAIVSPYLLLGIACIDPMQKKKKIVWSRLTKVIIYAQCQEL